MRTHKLVPGSVLLITLALTACGGGFPEPWADWGFPADGFDSPPSGDARMLQAGYLVPGSSVDAHTDPGRRFALAAPAVERLADAYRDRITTRGLSKTCELPIDRSTMPASPPGYEATFEGSASFLYLSVQFNDAHETKRDGNVLVTVSTDREDSPRSCRGRAH